MIGIPLSSKGAVTLNRHICDCDYFDFLKGSKKAIEEFSDIYLEDYSWGEETLAKLFQLKHKLDL